LIIIIIIIIIIYCMRSAELRRWSSEQQWPLLLRSFTFCFRAFATFD